MRTLAILLAAAMSSACSGSQTASSNGGSTSTTSTGGSSGSTGGSGGTTGGPASGTATITGAGSFTVGTTFFRWDESADGGVSQASAQIIFADVSATCAEVTDGLNNHFSAFTIVGLAPRVEDGGLVAGHYSYSETAGDPADGLDLGWFSVVVGGPQVPEEDDSLSADLSSVTDDQIAGSFTIVWSPSDGGTVPTPLQGTFNAPLCGPHP